MSNHPVLALCRPKVALDFPTHIKLKKETKQILYKMHNKKHAA